jgi:hypothetical protein
MNEHATNLKLRLETAFNFPPHLQDAFRKWIDSVELAIATTPSHRVASRLDVVERAVADLHDALSHPPAPAGVQKAVAEVEVDPPVESKKKS